MKVINRQQLIQINIRNLKNKDTNYSNFRI